MANTILTKTVASTGNNKILTWSGWVKRSDSSTGQLIMANGDPASSNYIIFFEFTGASLRFIIKSLSILANVQTNAVFRDTSAWYHLVFNMDTTQATASNRIKMYVNGEQITSFATATYPSQNLGTQFNTAGSVMSVGGKAVTGANTDFFNGYMAHVHFIDGTVYDADTFGETDATTGIWKPKTAPSVTYGTNGFFLKGENSGSLGTDSSGNANNFTVNGTPTQTIDTPSNVFATLNPLVGGTSTFSNGNLRGTIPLVNGSVIANLALPTTNKWYCEFKYTVIDGYVAIGLAPMHQIGWSAPVQSTPTAETAYYQNDSGGGFSKTGTLFTVTGTGGTTINVSTNNVYGLMWDADNNRLSIYDGTNTFYGEYTIADTSIALGFIFGMSSGSVTGDVSLNFGNGYFGTTAVSSGNADSNGLGIFEHTVPSGYYALCTKNINQYGDY